MTVKNKATKIVLMMGLFAYAVPASAVQCIEVSNMLRLGIPPHIVHTVVDYSGVNLNSSEYSCLTSDEYDAVTFYETNSASTSLPGATQSGIDQLLFKDSDMVPGSLDCSSYTNMITLSSSVVTSLDKALYNCMYYGECTTEGQNYMLHMLDAYSYISSQFDGNTTCTEVDIYAQSHPGGKPPLYGVFVQILKSAGYPDCTHTSECLQKAVQQSTCPDGYAYYLNEVILSPGNTSGSCIEVQVCSPPVPPCELDEVGGVTNAVDLHPW